MLIQAHLLTNPEEIPRLGWVRLVDQHIAELSYSPLPTNAQLDLKEKADSRTAVLMKDEGVRQSFLTMA